MRLCRFCAALFVWAAAAAAPIAEPLTAEKVLDAFARIAFGNEHEPAADPRLQKWASPIRWRAYEAVPLTTAERDFFHRHIERLARLTGLEFTPAESWPEANFVVYFVEESGYEAALGRHLAPSRRHLLPRLAAATCTGIQRGHRVTHVLEYAMAIIPVERARAKGLMESCIAEETTQLLGLPNDSDDVPDTLFNDVGAARDLTPLDEMLLRLLYHPRLQPGMRRAEALAVARGLLPALLGSVR